jgi:F420H(2)-dependent quinone reductase
MRGGSPVRPQTSKVFRDARRTDMPNVTRAIIRAGGAAHKGVYRVSGGRIAGKMRGLSLLLLTVRGRKSGVEHTTIVSYFEDAGRYCVTGSAGGMPSEPQWFRNLRSADQAVIEIGRRRIPVSVAVASPEEHAVLWEKLIAQSPGFAKYQAKIDRVIPIAALTPLP